jgi:hypothetical protein
MSEDPQPSDTQTGGSQRLGTYWHSETFDLARRAYLADLNTVPDGPDSLGAWIDAAIRAHTALSPQRRAEVADSLSPETKDPRGKSRSFIVAVSTVEALETALIEDRRHGRVLSRGAFVSDAVRAAARHAQDRYGGPPPPAPARLPNRPPRQNRSSRR